MCELPKELAHLLSMWLSDWGIDGHCMLTFIVVEETFL